MNYSHEFIFVYWKLLFFIVSFFNQKKKRSRKKAIQTIRALLIELH